MTHELILTSVAQGLDPNDHGFCPVAVDSAISLRIVQHLATLSNYRRLVAASDTSAHQNPIAYSHFILPGSIEHVVSRVADAGIDYQNQPNILAHHVVLEGMETTPEGPAWLLALPNFHLTEWKCPALQFTRGRPIPTLTTPPSLTRRQQIARQRRWLDPQKMSLVGMVDTQSESYRAAVQNNDEQAALAAHPTTPCPGWNELTGDPGWGGILAETAFTGQPVVLFYNPNQNILPLFVEALALLPLYSSWRVTFCTYFTELPETIPCQWKGVLAGSEEAKRLAKDANNLVLDLTIPLGEALVEKYVDFARHGQEYMLPVDAEEYITSLINADTKPYEDTKSEGDKQKVLPESTPSQVSLPPPQPIQLPERRTGLSELFLRRASRFQFYLLYSIMFVLVLVLLVLAIDQSGNFGILQRLQKWNQVSSLITDEPEQEPEPISPLDAEAQLPLDQVGGNIIVEPEDTRKIFAENRDKQRAPLALFWESFDIPEFLAINFPTLQDNHNFIDPPEKKTFVELCPLHPFGSALELLFIPLFELPKMTVHTRRNLDVLPNLVWQVEAIDTETHECTPMFQFQLTESGLEMNWQLEGLNPQHLYETILSSLGFLQLCVVESPESARQIPLFVPERTEPIKVSDLAALSGTETPEFVIELPFASVLWQRIFAEMDPQRTLRLEVWAEPEGDWVRIVPSPSSSEFRAEVRTSQTVGKPTESGETVFVKIEIPFVTSAALGRIVWKGGEYAERLQSEEELIESKKKELDEKIKRLDRLYNENDRQSYAKYNTELETLNLQLMGIKSIRDKLPAAYKELGQNESTCFHYSLFLEAAEGKRKLPILITVRKNPDGF